LAIALNSLANLKPEAIVHGDIKPDNLLVWASTGDLVVGDFGVAMWHKMRKGLRPAPWLLSKSAFVAPERRCLAIVGPHSGLDDDTKNNIIDELLEEIGGGKLDMWSLGVVAYLLALRKDPRGYDTKEANTKEAKMQEVDQASKRPDATEWLVTEMQLVWPTEDAQKVTLLAEVIAGTLQGLDKRLSASEVLGRLQSIGECMYQEPFRVLPFRRFVDVVAALAWCRDEWALRDQR
jgi:serine/threonine protein kinase